MTQTLLIEEGAQPRIFGLIKFIRRDNAASFRSGHMRMGTVQSYRQQEEEDAGGRNDPHEHLGTLLQSDRIVVKVNGTTLKGLAAPVEIRANIDDISYLLCMTAITDRALNAGGGTLRLDQRLLHLGDAAVIVTDVPEFERRLKVGIEAAGCFRSHAGQSRRASGLVEYVDLAVHHGNLGPFRKSMNFVFQHEWRLALIDSRGKPQEDHLYFNVGDLSDITHIMESTSALEDGIQALPTDDELGQDVVG